jgi:tRNA-splicing ligase RtcB
LYDIIVLGAGPAGLTAAMYAARGKLRTLVVVGPMMGGQISLSYQVDNYPGFPDGLTGQELSDKFKAHVERFAAEFIDAEATRVDFGSTPYRIWVGDKILEARTAKIFGITHEGQVTTMIHCGSRGFGHQICSDYLRVMERAISKYKIVLPDRELACAPGKSVEAQDYYQAMACAVNYAFANRQAIMHWVRQSFKQAFREDPEKFGLKLVYDVAHNIAKIEDHNVDGQRKKVWVHRKGATRAFPPGNPEIPPDYSSAGQPVLIPGSMGTSSWLLVGTEKAMELSFGSTAHGAGRMMSRTAAKRNYWGGDIKRALEQRGIYVRAASSIVLAEEADAAYKNVDAVAEVSDRVGIATKVARFVPIAVVKG